MYKSIIMEAQLTRTIQQKRSFSFSLITRINQKIEQEKDNAIGITIALIMFGTGIASLTAAMAVNGDVSMVILLCATICAMSANAIAISQQPFKIVFWAFVINIFVNSFLLLYQIINVWS